MTGRHSTTVSDAEIAVPQIPGDGLVGERFGKYLIVGELAMGGMAEVFLGVQRGLEGFTKVVVIKRVLPQFGANDEFVRMFVDEARLAARLEHPNIVRTYEFGEVAGRYFTTMEYLPGEDLNKVLNKLARRDQAMPIHLAAGVIARVCAGLHFAHQLTDTSGRPLGLVHRDINPANVVLTYGGEAKIIDFGVAKTNDHPPTVAGTIKGKIAYMSPEQLLARGIDRRSDIFSTGVVLWELLTGRPLFIRDNEASTVYAIMNDPIRPPSRFRPDVPRELDTIVMRALSRTPADRYDSAEEMQNALEAVMSTMPSCDPRTLGRTLEDLFGKERAEAKRSIAQTRALPKNISLVMKLRSEVMTQPPELAAGSDISEPIAADEPVSRGAWLLPYACAILIVSLIGAGLLYLSGGRRDTTGATTASHASRASLSIDSTPRGAAITIAGEPTGLTTPATVTGLTAGRVTIRLTLPDHESRAETIEVPESGAITKRFELAPTARTP